MKNKKFGICHICGKYGELTFEHIPPHGAFNRNKVIVYSGDDALKRYQGERANYIIRQKGMGKYSLCGECNNKTGTWYAHYYNDVVKDVMISLYENNTKPFIHGCVIELKFKGFPKLAFAKQVISMFCSLLEISEVRRLGFDQFLLDKESNKIDTNLFDLRMYLAPQKSGQLMIGPTAVCYKNDNEIETQIVSDLGAFPFGYILNLTPKLPIHYGTSIIDLINAEYEKRYDLKWELMYLERTNDILPLPLQFKPI